MFKKLQTMRLQAMKEKNNVVRYALESVISNIDAQRGRTPNFVVDNQVVISTIKKEIKAYSEMPNREAEVEFLTSLLPQQLSNDELKKMLDDIFETGDKPKDVMDKLNNLGYEGQYDKGFVAKTVMEKNK